MTDAGPKDDATRIQAELRQLVELLDSLAGETLDVAAVEALVRALATTLREPNGASPPPDAVLSSAQRLVHDVRSASGTILAWCHLLRRGGLAGEDVARGADVIERTVRRQLALVEQLAAEKGRSESETPVFAGEADLRGVRVLIVDDDAEARDVMRRLLAGCGAEVATAISAMDAFDVLQQGRPDVLISDIAMPDADGYALLRRVRAPDAGERGLIPAIAVTGRAGAADRQRALGAGYQLHLVKPVDPSVLINGVRDLAGR